MDIKEFFQLCAGKWFSQRTSHPIPPEQLEAGRSDLWVDLLPADDPKVGQLCDRVGTDKSHAILGVSIRWEGIVGADPDKKKGSTLMIPLSDGTFVQNNNTPGSTPMKGTYVLGNDDALTLVTESDTLHAEERIWFASSNLRLRNSTIRYPDGSGLASFCSEIRMGGVPPQ